MSFVGIPTLLYAPGDDFGIGQEVTYHFNVLDQQNVVVKYQLSNLNDSTTYLGQLNCGFMYGNGDRMTWGLFSCQNVPSGQACTTEVTFTPHASALHDESHFNVNYLPIDTNPHTVRMSIDTHNQTSSLLLDDIRPGLEVKIPQTDFTGFFFKMTIAPNHPNGIQSVWLGSESALQCAQVISGSGQNCSTVLQQFCNQAGSLSICSNLPGPTPNPPGPIPSNDILLYALIGFGIITILVIVLFILLIRRR